MKPEELRIGNLVYNEIDKKETTIYSIDEVGINQGMENNYGAFVEDINGIKLTEEGLKKFGFEKREFKDKDRLDEWVINWNIKGDGIKDGKALSMHVWKTDVKKYWGVTLWEVVPIDDVTIGVFKYVHQLQNLYFALTGNELKLKGSILTDK
jgi:hypothetical protein